MRKVLSISICFILIFSTVSASFGHTSSNVVNPNISIIKDNKSVRIAQSVSDGKIIKSIYHKRSNTLTTIIKDIDSKKMINKSVINLDTKEIDVSEYNSDGNITKSSKYEIDGENTFSNYEYRQYSDESWQIRRPKNKSLSYIYMNIDENSNNDGYLYDFKDNVEEINLLELSILGYHSASKLMQVLTVIIGFSGVGTPAAVGTGVTALGLDGRAVQLSIHLWEECEDARYNYEKVKLNSPEY